MLKNVRLVKPTIDYKEQINNYKESFLKNKEIIHGSSSLDNFSDLNEWFKKQNDAKEWTIISAGEEFADVELCNGQKIKAVGKLPLDEYGKMMLETKVGISLMVSPHPSYPPLEMSTFGVKVITNTYGNKNLETFNDNIVSLSNCSSNAVADKLVELCSDGKLTNKIQIETDYVKKITVWDKILTDVESEI